MMEFDLYQIILYLHHKLVSTKISLYSGDPKGQLNSEWIYEVIVSPKMPTKNYKDFCPTQQTRIVALFLVFFGDCRQFFWLQSLFVW